jgi:hypothetical protein
MINAHPHALGRGAAPTTRERRSQSRANANIGTKYPWEYRGSLAQRSAIVASDGQRSHIRHPPSSSNDAAARHRPSGMALMATTSIWKNQHTESVNIDSLETKQMDIRENELALLVRDRSNRPSSNDHVTKD